eukprot:CAMPEP_0206240126 /NCGR_PEP_ID=MMETSP0047_2-20121206/15769_1 /ASSEMBLY_ACC=CAM_ASM_000192 /TAXON_ID=195065 /ORGANISM="Chroomonas mesostigmatica_cf, Strain CCMP1168" /LENGTH=90 /DNA_ID=CAMNT_0053664881 /DNA_START=59 /DNA_END=327 /DNA_ORIENTATION=+
MAVLRGERLGPSIPDSNRGMAPQSLFNSARMSSPTPQTHSQPVQQQRISSPQTHTQIVYVSANGQKHVVPPGADGRMYASSQAVLASSSP